MIIPKTIFNIVELFEFESDDVSPKTKPSELLLFPKEKEKYNIIIKNTVNIIKGLKIKLLKSSRGFVKVSFAVVFTSIYIYYIL